MSQLNSFRFSIFVFALLNVAAPASHAVALTHQRPNPAAIKEKIYESFKAACDEIQDEESCREYARNRDCSWSDGKCKCVPEELAYESTLNSAAMVLISLATAIVGLAMLTVSDCGGEKCARLKTLTGAGLVLVSASLFYGAHIVKSDYKALLR